MNWHGLLQIPLLMDDRPDWILLRVACDTATNPAAVGTPSFYEQRHDLGRASVVGSHFYRFILACVAREIRPKALEEHYEIDVRRYQFSYLYSIDSNKSHFDESVRHQSFES